MSMDLLEQIEAFISGLPEPKRSDVRSLHERVLGLMPTGRLWFLDGTDDNGKVVTNPSIGYGTRTIRYANGASKVFHQVGISATTTGISVYVMGIADRQYLPNTYGSSIGKADVTGYCIKFKRLSDIHVDVLDAAIRDGVERSA